MRFAVDMSGLPQYEGLIPPPTTVDNTHKVYSVAIACAVLAAVTTLICSARLTHRFRERAVDVDDYALIVALVSLSELDLDAFILLITHWQPLDTLLGMDCRIHIHQSGWRHRQASRRDHSAGVHAVV